MNDLATDALTGADTWPRTLIDGLVPGLREVIADGIVVRDGVVTFAKDVSKSAGAPGIFPDLTYWECQVSSFHLDDVVPVTIAVSADHEPVISENDQTVMLMQGLGLGLQIALLARDLDEPIHLRCIISTNSTNGTFRFHRVREGETWLRPDLDEYQLEKLIVLDSQPASRTATEHGA